MTVKGISTEKMDWSSALQALNDIKGVVKATKDGDTIRITRTDGAGKPVTDELKIPDLDEPEIFSTSDLEQLIRNFDNLRSPTLFPITDAERQRFVDALKTAFDEVYKTDPKTVNGPFGDGPKRGASKALFDVYAIFKLLITVSQLQRNALRDVRQAENASVQKAILDAAAEQRSAALAGLIGGLVVCGIQLGLQGVTLYKQGKKFFQQMEIKNASGVSAAKTNLNSSKLARNEDAAQKNLDQLGKDLDKLDKDAKGKIDRNFDECKECKDVKELREKVGQNTEDLEMKLKVNKDMLDQLSGKSEKLGSLDDLKKLKGTYEKRYGELSDERTKLLGEEQDVTDNRKKNLEAIKKLEAKYVAEYEKDPKNDPLSKDLDGYLKGRKSEEEYQNLLAEQKKYDARLSEIDQKLNGREVINSDNGEKFRKPGTGLNEQCEDYKAKLDKAENDLKRKIDLVGENGDGGDIEKLRGKVQKLQEEFDCEIEKMSPDQKKDYEDLKQAQKDYCGKVDAIENEYKQSFEDARMEYRETLKTGKKEDIEVAKTKFDVAQKKYEYAHAKAIESKIANGGMSRMDTAMQYSAPDYTEVNIAQNDLMADDAYQQLEQDRSRLNIYEGMIQSGGMALQQVVQQISQLMQARAQTLGAKEQEARNELDQINDLFANCQKLLEAVLQAMIAVIQAESQSVDNTIAGLRG